MEIEVIKPDSRLDVNSSGRITALAIVNDSLWIGFANGGISIYKLPIDIKSDTLINNEKPIKSYKSINDIRTLFGKGGLKLEFSVKNVTVSSTPVTKILELQPQLQIGSASQVLVAIGDSEAIRVHEYFNRNLKFVQEFENSKNFVDFTFLKELRLFVFGNNKKKLIGYTYQTGHRVSSSSLSQMRSTSPLTSGWFKFAEETTLKDRIRKLSPYDDHGHEILVGLVNDFVIVNVDHQFKVSELPKSNAENPENTGLFHTSLSSFSYFGLNNASGPKTDMVKLDKNLVILAQDSLLIKYNRQKLTLTPIPMLLNNIPLDIVFIEPCYLALAFPKRLEVIDYETGELIQKFQHQINSNSIFLAKYENNLYLGSELDVLTFHIESKEEQISQYLSKRAILPKKRGANEDDLKLLGLEKAISYIARLEATDDYFNGGSDLKSKQLKLRELYLRKVIILFEQYYKYHEALVELGSDWLVSYKLILNLFPDYLNGEVQIKALQQHEQLEGEVDHEDRVSATESSNFGPSAPNVVKSVSLNNLLNHELSVDSGTEYDTEKSRTNKTSSPQATEPTNIKRFTRAVSNLIVYLTDERRIILNFEASHSIKWNGITLHWQDVYGNSSLENVSSVIDTSLFLCYFHTKPMLLGPLLRLPNNRCNSKIVNQCLLQNLHSHDYSQLSKQTQPSSYIKELLDFYYGRSLHKEALQMLYKLSHDGHIEHNDEFDDFIKGPDLSIQYLQKLDNSKLDLIFEFSEWIFKESNTSKLLLLSASIFMNDSYECESYDGFKVLDYLTAKIGNDDLVISYLEWLIFESDVIEKYKGQRNSVLKLHTRLCTQYLEKLKKLAKEDDEAFANSVWYTKLYSLLDTTNQYEPWTVLKNIPTSDSKFLRFTVLIYRRLGEHDKSIDVLFNQLDNLDAAMEYCSSIYYQPHYRATGERLLHKLLEDLLLAGGNNEQVEKLLNQEGSKMSTLRVLTSLPNSFPIQNLSFLTNTLRGSKDELHDSRISTQLYKVGLIKLKSNLLESQKEFVKINNGSEKCSICQKKLGYSIFCADKKGHISHYGCQQQLQQHQQHQQHQQQPNRS